MEDVPDGRLGAALRQTAGTVADVVSCRCAVIAVLDRNGRLEHFVAAGPDEDAVRRAARLPVRDGPLAAVLEGRRVRLDHGAPGAAAALEPLEINSVFGMPIEVGGRPVGGLYLCDLAQGGEPEPAALLADVIANVIRRKRVRQAAEQRHRWLMESAELTRALLSGADVDPLGLVVAGVREMADSDLIAVLGERPDGRSYEIIEAAGPHAAALQGRVVSADATFASRVITEGTPRVVSDLSAAGRQTELADLVGAASAILVPFSGAGIERGLLTLYRRPERPRFTEAEAEAATLFATQMSLALELAETRANRERSLLVDERGRIARDLHDHVIQRLFAIGLTLASAATQPADAAAPRLQECVDGIDEAITQIRSTIYQLTGPLVTAENSVRARAGQLVDDMSAVLGFRADLDVQGPLDFGVDDELTDDCIAVLREALTNVAKHAGAGRVTVTIIVGANELTLQVTDDGRGIGAVTRRSGLANLRTRAERRRGRLIVGSGVARGTRLTWIVPLDSASRPVRTA